MWRDPVGEVDHREIKISDHRHGLPRDAACSGVGLRIPLSPGAGGQDSGPRVRQGDDPVAVRMVNRKRFDGGKTAAPCWELFVCSAMPGRQCIGESVFPRQRSGQRKVGQQAKRSLEYMPKRAGTAAPRRVRGQAPRLAPLLDARATTDRRAQDGLKNAVRKAPRAGLMLWNTVFVSQAG